MNLLEGLKQRLGGEGETTSVTLEKEFSGIEPIKAIPYDPNKKVEGTSFEFSGKEIKIVSSDLPPTLKGKIWAWMAVKPSSGEPTQIIRLVAGNDISPARPLTLSYESAKEGRAAIYLRLGNQKRLLTGIDVPPYLMRDRPFSR